MNEIKDNIFLIVALRQIPRLLGQLNRNPLSESYGSFDRAYWHYRTNDISCARHQEAVLTLALLYIYYFPGNIYYNNQQILEWINSSLEFTLSIQNKDGSFNEWYINEQSFVATSFITAALAETLTVLGKNNIRQYEKILSRLVKAADWIAKHTEIQVINQLAGSVLALAKIAALLDSQVYRMASHNKLSIIEKAQSSEGWWSEYGGPDIGYLSLMIDYLAKYYKLERSEKILSMIKKASSFLVNFLHPNLTAAGEYMSRNTEYIIPSGFASLATLDENANIITAFNMAALAVSAGIGPANLDDRYLCYILYNWLQAGIYLSDNNARIDIASYLKNRRLDLFFKDSGLRVIQNENYYFVANLYKGGVFRLYAGGREYLDSGIEIKYRGRRFIANVLDYGNKLKIKDEFMEVSGCLKPVQETLMKTPLVILFKLWQITLGRISGTQILLKNFLRKEMITYKKSSGIFYKREFILTKGNIAVNDEVGAPVSKKDFYCGLKTSYNFIPSSKYFTIQEIGNKSNLAEKKYSCKDEACSLRRTFNF